MIEKYYEKKLRERDAHIVKLNGIIAKTLSMNKETANDYNRAAEETENKIYKLDFLARASGLLEANVILSTIMADTFKKN